MRTLYEIITAIKDGEMPTYEECYWAALALEALHGFDYRTIERLAEKGCDGPFGASYQLKESFNRVKGALEKTPKEWVGPNNDPANPSYQRERAIGKKIIERVIKKVDNV